MIFQWKFLVMTSLHPYKVNFNSYTQYNDAHEYFVQLLRTLWETTL